MSEKYSVEVGILDQKYVLKGESDPAYMHELAAQLDARLRELHKPGVAPHRTAILAGFILLDELTKARRALDAERQRSDQAARAAAQMDLRLQTLLEEAAKREAAPPGPLVTMEEQPEVLDVGRRLSVDDLFEDGGPKAQG